MKSHTVRSPLRWVGGKTRAIKLMAQIIPDRPEIISPFFGGGSYEIAMAQAGKIVHGYDADPALVAFWQEAIADPEGLADRVRRYGQMDKQKFRILKSEMKNGKMSRQELAAGLFVVNRCARAGNIHNGGFNNPLKIPAYERFTPSSIAKLAAFKVPNLTVERADFRDSLAAHPNAFPVADPPYDIKAILYRGHDGFPHEELAKILKARGDFVCCYNDDSFVRDLYAGCKFVKVGWAYGMSPKVCDGAKKSDEVLIFGRDTVPRLKDPMRI